MDILNPLASTQFTDLCSLKGEEAPGSGLEIQALLSQNPVKRNARFKAQPRM